MTYIRDEGDEAVAPDFVLLSLRFAMQTVAVIAAADGAAEFVNTGGVLWLVGALLVGNAWARL